MITLPGALCLPKTTSAHHWTHSSSESFLSSGWIAVMFEGRDVFAYLRNSPCNLVSRLVSAKSSFEPRDARPSPRKKFVRSLDRRLRKPLLSEDAGRSSSLASSALIDCAPLLCRRIRRCLSRLCSSSTARPDCDRTGEENRPGKGALRVVVIAGYTCTASAGTTWRRSTLSK